jgi:DNA polymerase-1
VWFEHKTKDDDYKTGLARIQHWIDRASLIVMQNGKYDMNVLQTFGIDFYSTPVWDTMIAQYLINGQDKTKPINLNELASTYNLPLKPDKVKTMWDAGYQTNAIPVDILEEYALHDSETTLAIYEKQKPVVQQMGLMRVATLQFEFSKMLSEMESRGILVDEKKAEKYIAQFEKEKLAIAGKLDNLFAVKNVNYDSGDNISALLFGGEVKYTWEEWYYKECKTKPYTYYYPRMVDQKKKYKGMGWTPDKKTEKKKGGYFSTDKDTINNLKCRTKIQRTIKKHLIEYSEIKKAKETLIGKTGKTTGLLNKIAADGMVHTSYNQTVTVTGRLSSSNPNSQNFPREKTSPIKSVIVPVHDGIMNADLSQIEWRAAAFLSQDRMMIKEVNSDIDQHNAACTDLMELTLNKENRTDAKIFNFRMIYGGTAYGYYMDPKMPSFSLKKWEKTVSKFFSKYFGLENWQNKNVTKVHESGKLTLPTGRWFQFHKTKIEKGGGKTYNVRQVKNYPVQGISGGDILPLAAVIIWHGMKEKGMKSDVFLTVHDSLVFDYVQSECKELAELCIEVFNRLPQYIADYFGVEWNVKLAGEVEIGPDYGSMSEYL